VIADVSISKDTPRQQAWALPAPVTLFCGAWNCSGGSPQDVYLGKIADCDFYIGAAQFEYWQHTQLIIDVGPGRGSGFSAEAPEGVRFLTRSRVFTDEEVTAIEAAGPPAAPHKALAAQRVNRTLQNYGVAARLQTRSISISALYASPVTPTQVRAGSRSTGK